MEFTDEEILEFKRIWKDDFGEEISDAFARERAGELLRLYEALAQPLPSERRHVPAEEDPTASSADPPPIQRSSVVQFR